MRRTPSIAAICKLATALHRATHGIAGARDWQTTALSLDSVVENLARRKRRFWCHPRYGGLHARLALRNPRRAARCRI